MANHQQSGMPPHTPEILRRLKQYAADKATVTYGRLVRGSGVPPQSVGEQLSYIHEQICRPRNLPWLCVLAVSAKSGLPSPGVARATGVSFSGPGGKNLWETKVQEVHDYDNWPEVDI